MAKKLNISLEAISDLEEIWDYIAIDSPRNADRFVDQEIVRILRGSRDVDSIFNDPSRQPAP